MNNSGNAKRGMEPAEDSNASFVQARLNLMRKLAMVQQHEQATNAAALFQQQQLYVSESTIASLFRNQNLPDVSLSSFHPKVFQEASLTHNNCMTFPLQRGVLRMPALPSMNSDPHNAFTPSVPTPRGGTRIISSQFISASRKTSNSGTAISSSITTTTPPTELQCSHKRCHSNGMDSLTVPSSSAATVSAASSVTTVSPIRDTNGIPVPAASAPPSLIHQACELYAQMETIVTSAIRVDPAGVRRRLSSCASKKRRKHAYDYPINIALKHRASVPVIQLLADAAPDILVERDGAESYCTLSCALLQRRKFDVVSLLLEANPDQVRVPDRYRNFPLHTACAHGASLPVVKLLASAYPNAIRKKNFHGQTPLDIAQQRSCCSDDVIDYLQESSFGILEENALHLDDLDNFYEDDDALFFLQEVAARTNYYENAR